MKKLFLILILAGFTYGQKFEYPLINENGLTLTAHKINSVFMNITSGQWEVGIYSVPDTSYWNPDSIAIYTPIVWKTSFQVPSKDSSKIIDDMLDILSEVWDEKLKFEKIK